MSSARSPLHGHPTEAGFSLVELMVALALGLFVAAMGTTLLVSQWRESRSIRLEFRLTQDMRTAVALLTRDLRRSGFWGHAEGGVWMTGTASPPASNPYAASPSSGAASDAVLFRYSRDAVENDAVDHNEQFGYRLRNGALEVQLGLDNWQALTDTTAMRVVDFSVSPTVQDIPLAGACAHACPASIPSCQPSLQVRSLAVRVVARSAVDARVLRSLRSDVRLRNDTVVGRCPSA